MSESVGVSQGRHKTPSTNSSPLLHRSGSWTCPVALCRRLYNTALEQRIIALPPTRRLASRAMQQEAELKDIRAAFPEYAAIHSHVLQDVLARLDKTYQAFFRRVQRG